MVLIPSQPRQQQDHKRSQTKTLNNYQNDTPSLLTTLPSPFCLFILCGCVCNCCSRCKLVISGGALAWPEGKMQSRLQTYVETQAYLLPPNYLMWKLQLRLAHQR
jgi:hypothetical protein